MKRIVYWTAAAAMVLVNGQVAAKIKPGQLAPKFKATTFEGTKVSNDDYRGKVLIVNFWATWCGPCKTELPLLNGYHKAMEKHGLRVLAITTEDSLPPGKLKPLQAALSFPLAKNFSGSYFSQGEPVPTNFVIDRRGVVRYAKAGSFNLAQLNEIIVPLLNEPAPPEVVPQAAAPQR